MWDLIENEYSKKYGIGCATFFRDKQLKTAMVMYKYNGRSVMFCYSEYDNKILSDGDKIVAEDGDTMKVIDYDFYGTGQNIMCFMSDRCVYPSTEFNAGDWEIES